MSHTCSRKASSVDTGVDVPAHDLPTALTPDAAPVARYYRALADGTLVCGLCHHRCHLAQGKSGICGVRKNDGGRLELPFYGFTSALSVDPIEKKPLYHFMPGSSVFSVGYVGCNLHCPFCQNFAISQSTKARGVFVLPEDLAREAKRLACSAIAHTYSEPIVHAEFVEESMRLARASGLLSILVTNGCASADAARDLLSLCDAVNVDLKAWDPDFYAHELGGERDSVLRFIRLAHTLGVHLEVTTLVIPGKNDTESQIDGIASFLASLSVDIPLHLSAYRPMYLYRTPATSPESIRHLVDRAREQLRYVYSGNVPGEPLSTLCQSCGATLVARQGYAVDSSGLSGTRCSACGAESPIRIA